VTKRRVNRFLSRHPHCREYVSEGVRVRSVPRITVILLSLLFCFFLFSCSTAPTVDDLKMAESHNKRGASYLSNGELNKAFVEFQEALKANPEDKETLNFLGYISTRYGKYKEAVSYYKKAVAIDPNYSEAVNNLGIAYAELEQWDEAIHQFNTALNDPTYRTPDRAYSNLGFVYYMKGEYGKAEKALKEALVRNPVSARAVYVLGLVYIQLGNDDLAIDSFMKAIGMVPDYIDAHWELANVYLRTGDKARALKHFEVVAEKGDNPARIRKASEYIQDLKYAN
jgi:type IV pilus assembly protein PilF